MACQSTPAHTGKYHAELQQIQQLWQTCNQCTALEQILTHCFSSAENPYDVALYLMSNADGYLLSKKISLSFYIMETFKKWLKDKENLLSCLNPNLKLESFLVVNQQKNFLLVKLLAEVYQLVKDKELFLPFIRERISSQKYKQACECVEILKLHSYFDIKDFVVQLIFQDKLTVVENFLRESPKHQQDIVLYLDELLGKRNINEVLRATVQELNISDVNHVKLKGKCLSKLVGRYLKKYKLPLEMCVNYTYQQKKRALSYLIRKRYDEENLEGEGWNEMVLDNVKDNIELQYTLIDMLVDRSEVDEAFHWSKILDLEVDKLPANVRFCYGNDNSKPVLEEESWDDNAAPSYLETARKFTPNVKKSKQKSAHYYDDSMLDDEWDMETSSGTTTYMASDNFEENDDEEQLARPMKNFGIHDEPLEEILPKNEEKREEKTTDYHALSLPESSVIFVDTAESFRELLEVGMKGVDVIGLDCEWKPSFTSKKNSVALMQLATWDRIYLIDVLAFHDTYDSLWTAFNQEIFENGRIIKLGFDVKADKSMVLESIPHLKGYGSPSFLDLASLWMVLANNYAFRFPHQVGKEQCGKSLSQLVKICFGKTLDKTDQFSNWENRPLRGSQKLYAALDAYCLLEVFDYLKNESINQNVPFEELLAHSLKDLKVCSAKQSKGKTKKPRKIIDPMSILETQAINVHSPHPPISAQSIRMLCDNMVHGLGRKLRSCGIDTWIPLTSNDARACVNIALRDHRVILTRGGNYRKFVSFVGEDYCYQLKSDLLEDQIKEVLSHFNIALKKDDIFSRCQVCNGHSFAEVHNSLMQKIVTLPGNGVAENSLACGSDGNTAMNRIPPLRGQRWHSRDGWSITELKEVTDVTKKGAKMKLQAIPLNVVSSVEYFYVCEKCGKVYWNGSHFRNELARKRESNLLH